MARVPGWKPALSTVCAADSPREPVRTLDALHLATVLRVAEFRPGLDVLSFDRRIRANAAAPGFGVLHADPPAGRATEP